ncbi:MAG: hypothetical protein DMG57_34770 [Acidobacteria bacterium]|nr:MAG: hypothetical protein DMG57_34770 [Acidobacteriota bacterium]
MVREMSFAPERLRDAEQHAQICREQQIQERCAKKGTVDEIVRDGVRVPPHTDCDDGCYRPLNQYKAVKQGESDKKGVPP